MRTLILALALGASAPLAAQTAPAPDTGRFAAVASGLSFRSIGPALTSGRVADIAVHPTDKKTWYVASAAGGVWKTTNAGLSFAPVFDGEGSFSIGVVTIDPKNPSVVWVGTGENNAQRVVAYGDGVYKSIDGGKSWTNTGLKDSEHIGRIVIDPRNSDVVYVAAQGPLWRKGGERGVYKTTDGGKTWNRVLAGDDWTGANDVQLDPRNPDILIATLWQRQRRTCCFIAGGPGSGVFRSTDGGKTWNKSQSGFPSEDLGRIGLSQSPANPNVVYAIADAAQGKGGTFRSRDGGASWEKMSGYQSGSNYYNEVFADPKNPDRVYAIDVLLQVSEDGGKSFHRVGELLKHVDNHVVWIDPDDTDHLIVGCDGGVYETVDRGRTWRFMANLPISQYYRVATDNSQPFYRVYGGAQDNFSVGGPSRTRTNNGIRNADWFITSGGDGFGSVVDPEDPNTVYAQSQFGNLARFNLRTGDVMGIQPEDAAGGAGFRWNWDSPLLVSPHSHTRLYFANNRVMRSDDRGDSWHAVSPDLTRQIDRNALRMMDRVWGPEAVGKNASTTLYGNIFALAESPLKEGLLFAGTDDGRIQISENGGGTWRAIDHFPGVPDTTFVSRVIPSQHDANTVYATFNNHQTGDFTPYVLKSTDLGRTWTSIAGDLPPRGTAWVIAEDPVDRNLLFVGTEFGVYASREGGNKWVRLKGGLPTIQVRDIAIQKRSNDLVLATFGRGFYILDDYAPLRDWKPDAAAQTRVYPSRSAFLYAESSPLGLPGSSFQGQGQYLAENPLYGALITYSLKDGLKSLKARRREADAAALKKNVDSPYPAWDSLKVEDRQEDPAVIVAVSDSAGRTIRRFTAPATAGLHRVAWDLRLQPTDPVNGPPYAFDPEFPFSSPPAAPFVVPGTYQVSLWSRVDGAFARLGDPIRVSVMSADAPEVRLNGRTVATLTEQMRTAELERSVLGTGALLDETATRVGFLKRAIDEAAGADTSLARRVRDLEMRVRDAQELLNGDPTRARRNEASPPSLLGRLQNAIGNGWSGTLEAPTAAQQAQIDIVRAEFGRVLDRVRQLVEVDLKALETAAEQAGVPWTPGRVPKAPM